MRIVGGRHRGTALSAPKSRAVRPTSDRTREAVFNILAHGAAAIELEGARVLDLFAGTGALGLEALSRGARFCLFIDNSSEGRALVRHNVETLKATGAAKIWRRDATRLGDVAPMQPFDLVFADPPYGRGLGAAALASVLAGGWLAPGGIALLEESAEAEIAVPPGLAAVDRRVYGDTQLLFLKRED
ncbi:16S rRNA (guanine(966)-N(2))-methyltransferase RsmD [Kaustia mangrovi]|uniref:16S rRNA (Guanine(966)-N(2))-methyltransferase RsmD n=1 Tax=Kaustia mangrovi TaxID=2593653 RepID=A0A7S8HDN7_9HYPH|nr:16S rRNA (guanine(966)-N(2))-methyltransferase RsmD [Kaustia mangrovi]QPC44850.1 16S rRNA (guanine(966)-N(2))-methyltransferase RsmD [Kaustia mangrovi]